jgi:hypothetical protein
MNPARDRVFEALSHCIRRRLLLALLTNTSPVSDPADAVTNGRGPGVVLDRQEGAVDVALHHNHLPKLAEYGYITRNSDSGSISRGEQWSEIEPFLRLLNEHSEQLPGGRL